MKRALFYRRRFNFGVLKNYIESRKDLSQGRRRRKDIQKPFLWFSYHNVAMNKATPQASWPQVRIFLGTGYFNVPDFFPRLVETLVNRINSRVVWTHAISTSGWDSVVLCELLIQRHVQL